MGLKCRLLGHTYGDTDVQRTREEQGDEVVVTIREVKVCERCGAEQTVSQNKEVTAIRTPAEVGMEDPNTEGTAPAGEPDPDAQPAAAASTEEAAESADESAPATDAAPTDADGAERTDGEAAEAADPSTAESAEGPPSESGAAEADSPIDEAEAASDGWETGSGDWEDVDTDGDDGVILDEAETERDEAQWPEGEGADPASAAQQPQSAESGELVGDNEAETVTNDAEIIDGAEPEDAPRERGHGEWPERDDEPGADGWPEHESEDEGFDAATNVDEDDVELGGSGLTPEVNGRANLDESDTVQGVAVEDSRPSRARQPGQSASDDDGFARAESSTTLESDVPDDRVEFYCPNCGHARSAGASSMRAGDICPECRRGYIAERER